MRRQQPTSCLALIQCAERFFLTPHITLNCQLLHADQYLFIHKLGEARVHIIISLVLAKCVADDSLVAMGLQRLGDIFLMSDKDISSARACYQANMDIIQYFGVRRPVADCVLRFGIVFLLEGKIVDAKRKFTNSRRIYKLAEDSQGYNYCEAVLAECEIDGPKVRGHALFCGF